MGYYPSQPRAAWLLHVARNLDRWPGKLLSIKLNKNGELMLEFAKGTTDDDSEMIARMVANLIGHGYGWLKLQRISRWHWEFARQVLSEAALGAQPAPPRKSPWFLRFFGGSSHA